VEEIFFPASLQELIIFNHSPTLEGCAIFKQKNNPVGKNTLTEVLERIKISLATLVKTVKENTSYSRPSVI
jgi:hypothetical protein